MSLEIFLQLLINGFLLGGFYATAALGFSTIWGVMRLINLAHGEFLLMGAFTAWFFFNPLREQNLTLSSSDPTTTGIVLGLVGLSIGFFLSSRILPKTQRGNLRMLKILVPVAAVGAALLVHLLWSASEFTDVTISVMSMIMVGLVLATGFFISHVLMGTVLQGYKLLTRRVVGYGIAVIAVVIGYSLWQGSGFPSIDPFLSLPLIFILFFGLGYLLQKGLFGYLVDAPFLTMLLVTFGVAIILQSIGLTIYAADPRKINVDYGVAVPLIGSVTLPVIKTLIAVISVGMIAGLVLFLRRTRIGYAVRAAAQNKMAARLMGINVQEIYALTFAISIALTAMAGAMMGTFQPISPVNGPMWTLRAFVIVALGGLGKVQGVVVGGLVLGMVESILGGLVGIGWAIAGAFVLLVIMLIVRPQGLTGSGQLVTAEE